MFTFQPEDRPGQLPAIPPVSVQNEIKALETVREAARVSLARFPTSLEEDVKLAQAGFTDFNVRNCVLQRKYVFCSILCLARM